MMKYRVLYCFQKHSIRLAADPTPRPVSCSGIGGGGEAVTGPGCCQWFEPKAMQTCSEHSARACASAAAAAPAPAPGCGFKAHAAGDAGCSEKAKKNLLWRAQSLGIDAGQSRAPRSAWRNTSEALCSAGLQRSRALQQGPGAPAQPCRDSRVPALAWRPRGMGSSGCCRAQRSGFPEQSCLARQAGAWAKTALSHAGMSAEPVARASTVPAEAGHCWRDCAEMRAPRARGGLPNCWSHLPF